MRISLAILLTLLYVLSTSLSAKEAIRLSSTDDILTKISSKILLHAYSQIGVPVEIVSLPAARALLWSNSGTLDGEVSRIAKISEKYPNLVRVSVPINRFEAIAFTRRTDIAVGGWESLRPYSIIIRTGSGYAELGTQGMKVFKLASHEQVFRVLNTNYYDVAVNTRMTGIVQIETLGLTGVRVLEPPLEVYDLYHFLHKKHQKLIPKITQALVDMKENGLMEKIRADYFKQVVHEARNNRERRTPVE